MFTTARLADRIAATYRVTVGPRCQKTSPICVAIPTGPETGGAPVGSSTTEVDEAAQAVDDQSERAHRPFHADRHGAAGV